MQMILVAGHTGRRRLGIRSASGVAFRAVLASGHQDLSSLHARSRAIVALLAGRHVVSAVRELRARKPLAPDDRRNGGEPSLTPHDLVAERALFLEDLIRVQDRL